MRFQLAALLVMIPGFTACVAIEPGSDEDDVDVESTSQELVGTNSCSYVAPTCEAGWSLRIDFVGTVDMCYRAGVFGASWHDVLCPADHPVRSSRPGNDRCGLASCNEY